MRRACLVDKKVDAVDRRARRRSRPMEAAELDDDLRDRTDTNDYVHPDGVPAIAHSCVRAAK